MLGYSEVVQFDTLRAGPPYLHVRNIVYSLLTFLEAKLACTSLDRFSLENGQMGDRPTHAAPNSASAAWTYYAPCGMINRSSATRHT